MEKNAKGRNINRLLSVVLALVMVFTLMPMNSFTVYAAEQVVEVGTAEEFMELFEDIASTRCEPKNSETVITLTDDVTLPEGVYFHLRNKSLTLNLDGHTLNLNKRQFALYDNGKFIVNGAGNGGTKGTIKGGYAYIWGGVIYGDSGLISISDTILTENYAEYGGAGVLLTKCDTKLFNCEITNNSTGGYGAVVAEFGTLTIGGTTHICDNTTDTGKSGNLCVVKEQATIAFDEFSNQSLINIAKVTLDGDNLKGEIVSKEQITDEQLACFHSDYPSYVIKRNQNGRMELTGIVQEPSTSNNYTVVTEDTSVSYQWYEKKIIESELKNVLDTDIELFSGTKNENSISSGEYGDKNAIGLWMNGLYSLTFTCTNLTLEVSEFEDDSIQRDGENYTYTASGGCAFIISNDGQEFNIENVTTYKIENKAVEGQNTASLTAGENNKTYYCMITYSNGDTEKTSEVTISSSHTHNYTYTASGATLTATCSADGCELTDKKVELTLTATSPTYSGSAVTVGKEDTNDIVLSGYDDWKATVGEPTVVFYTDVDCADEHKTTVGSAGDSTSGAATVGGAPVNTGEYWAAVTYENTNGDKATAKVAFEIKKYVKVTFDSNGGTEVVSQIVINGTLSSMPADPTRADSTFNGWYTSDGTKFDFDTPITNDITITARWTLNQTDSKETTVPTVHDQNSTTTKIQVTGDQDVKASGLEELAKIEKESNTTQNVKVVLNVEKKTEASIGNPTETTAIKNSAKASNANNKVDFLSITLQKTVGTDTNVITDTGAFIIEAIIPYSTTDKTLTGVYRYHGSAITAFTKDALKTGAKDTYYYEDGYIHIFSNLFSTYAVSYTKASGGSSGGGYIPTNASSIKITATSKTVLTSKGDTLQLAATITPSNTDNQTLTWKSSDEKVLTVDTNGKVTAVAEGKAKITVSTSNGKTDTVELTVKYAPVVAKGITVEKDKVIFTKAGETATIKATIQPTNTTDQTLTYSSSDEKVAKVDSKGTITAVKNGTATITVKTTNGLTKTINVTVNIPSDNDNDVTPAKITANTLAINEGFKVSQTGSKINVSWGKVLEADGYLVYATYCGTNFNKKPVKTVTDRDVTKVTITKLGGKALDLKRSYKLYVKAYKLVDGKKVFLGKSITAHIVGARNTSYTNVKAIELTSKSKFALAVGKTSKIKASVVLVDSAKKQLSDAHAAEFRYASSNKKIATVDKNGKITAKAKGTCYIYVYAKNGYAKKVKVTVK